MLRHVVASSTLRSIGYAGHDAVLEVEFTSGAVYHYLEVPPRVFKELLAAASKGAYFNQHIRDQFKAELIRD